MAPLNSELIGARFKMSPLWLATMAVVARAIGLINSDVALASRFLATK
jgi:hypothetical protein